MKEHIDVIAFTKVKLPFGWLGNMSPFPIEFEGECWRTAEGLFQAMRFQDRSIKDEIRRQASPMAAKLVAKRHAAKMMIQPRSPEDVQNMRGILRLKVTQHVQLRDALLETGSRPIIEDCGKRRNASGLFWGAAKVDGRWEGQNMLGRLWTELRDELRNEAAAVVSLEGGQ